MAAALPAIPPIIIEHADIGFRNFSGKEGKFNPPGKKTFVVFLDTDHAEELERQGWNVKYLKPRDEDDEPKAYLSVEAKFTHKPPVVALITSGGRTTLDEQTTMILDFADIKQVDLVINASRWDVNGKQGVKAYLKSIYVTIHEDALELKYRDVPELGASSARMAIEAPSEYDENVVAVF